LAFQCRIDVVERYQAATDKQSTQTHDDTSIRGATCCDRASIGSAP
jgi:hypothetical protein